MFLLNVQLQKAETSEADEADEEPTVVQSTQVFAPKSLVVVSRLDHIEVFRVQHSCTFCSCKMEHLEKKKILILQIPMLSNFINSNS